MFSDFLSYLFPSSETDRRPRTHVPVRVMYAARMHNEPAAGRLLPLLLRAFIAFRIETPSGNIFPRANLIKARQTGLLNEQTVVACVWNGAARRWYGQVAARCWRANAILCLSFSHFAPVIARHANLTRVPFRPAPSRWYPSPEEPLIFRTFSRWSPASFCRENEFRGKANKIYINIFDARHNPLFCVIPLSIASLSCCIIKRRRDACRKDTSLRYKESER